jgi:hypothetical protein
MDQICLSVKQVVEAKEDRPFMSAGFCIIYF